MGTLLLMLACALVRVTAAVDTAAVCAPSVRMEHLLNASGRPDWTEHRTQCFWHADQPVNLTPVHVHGGLGQ